MGPFRVNVIFLFVACWHNILRSDLSADID